MRRNVILAVVKRTEGMHTENKPWWSNVYHVWKDITWIWPSSSYELGQETARVCSNTEWWHIVSKTGWWRCHSPGTKISPCLSHCLIQQGEITSQKSWERLSWNQGWARCISAGPFGIGELYDWNQSAVRWAHSLSSFRYFSVIATTSSTTGGVDIPSFNTTRLIDKLLAEILELQAHKKGRGVLLAFQKDVALSLPKTSEYSDALVMAKAAKVLRRHMLDHQSKFDGTFPEGCVKDAIRPILLQFVRMVEHETDIKSHLRFGTSKSDQAISQLLQYNCYSRYKEGTVTHRHSKER